MVASRMVRTQIYLSAAHLRALRRAAAETGVSVTEVVRRLVAEHVEGRRGVRPIGKEQVMRFVALGRSGHSRTSENHDRALDEAMRASAV
ncbi:MAG: hypothetical protein FD160_4214, partial [Caulobacteraceae bacterium]